MYLQRKCAGMCWLPPTPGLEDTHSEGVATFARADYAVTIYGISTVILDFFINNVVRLEWPFH